MVNNIANYLPSSMLHNPYGVYGNTGASGLYGTNSIYGYGYGNQDYSYYYLQDQSSRNTTQEASLAGGAITGAAAGYGVACLMAKGASVGFSTGGVLGVLIGAGVGLLAGIFINKFASR